MKVLSIDTSQDYLGIGLIDNDEVLIDLFLQCKNKQSTIIFAYLKELLFSTKISIQEIDVLAVTSGPGSFTGLRIGMSITKSLAHVLNKPIIGVSTLDVFAGSPEKTNHLICSTLLHLKNEIFYSFYSNKDGQLIKMEDIKLCSIDDFLVDLENRSEEKILLVGNAINNKHNSLLSNTKKFYISNTRHQYINPVVLAKLGLSYYNKGEYDTVYNLNPLYMKEYYNPFKREFPIERAL